LAAAVRTVTGQSLKFAYELRADLEASIAPAAPGLSEEELVARFMEEFDAQELPADDQPQEA
jgi:DNA polymerase-3 subunit gamma/tau